jgi:hypothetical protein
LFHFVRREKDDPIAQLGSNEKWGKFGSRCLFGKKAFCCRNDIECPTKGSSTNPAANNATTTTG